MGKIDPYLGLDTTFARKISIYINRDTLFEIKQSELCKEMGFNALMNHLIYLGMEVSGIWNKKE